MNYDHDSGSYYKINSYHVAINRNIFNYTNIINFGDTSKNLKCQRPAPPKHSISFLFTKDHHAFRI